MRKFKMLLIALCGLLAGCAAAPAYLAEERPLPVLMYHSVLRDPARAGAYVVSPDTLRADLVYLKSAGYESVVVADLIAYVRYGGTLPAKPVMITLDDGHYNNLTYVLPILEELNMRAVLSVVGSYTESFSAAPDPNPGYAYLSWDEIRTLNESGRVEIQNHSYAMHEQSPRQGSKRMSGESEAAYRAAFCADAMRLQALLDERCGVVATAYTYPYGRISPEAEGYLRELGFAASLSCYERLNFVTREPDCLFSLGRYNRPAGMSTEEFMKKALVGA